MFHPIFILPKVIPCRLVKVRCYHPLNLYTSLIDTNCLLDFVKLSKVNNYHSELRERSRPYSKSSSVLKSLAHSRAETREEITSCEKILLRRKLSLALIIIIIILRNKYSYSIKLFIAFLFDSNECDVASTEPYRRFFKAA